MSGSIRAWIAAVGLMALIAGPAAAQLSATEQAYLDTLQSGGQLGSADQAKALWEAGRRLTAEGRDAEAFDVFSALEAAGSAQAAGVVGDMYRQGEGVAKDPAEAATHYQRSADGGDDYGHFRLALAYQRGEGVAQDWAAAADHFRSCADLQRDQEGICARGLANSYEFGRGVPEDKDQAYAWYLRGAELGEKVCQRKVGYFMTNGIGTPADPAGAIAWYEKAAAQDEPDALYNLGYAYYAGRGVTQDMAKAHAWFEKAQAAGSAEAARALAILDAGTGGAH